jgi:hypothetical protein
MSKAKRMMRKGDYDLRGRAPESWCCVDCGVNTAPGFKSRAEVEQALKSQCLSASGKQSVPLEITARSEIYMVHEIVWRKSGMQPMGGCLCIGCLEKRLGRQLRPKDFMRDHPFNDPDLPGTVRLMSRKEEEPFCFIEHEDGLYVVVDGKATAIKTMEEGEEIIRQFAAETTLNESGTPTKRPA